MTVSPSASCSSTVTTKSDTELRIAVTAAFRLSRPRTGSARPLSKIT